MVARQSRDGSSNERAPRLVPGRVRAARRWMGLAGAIRARRGGGDRRRPRTRGRPLPRATDRRRAAAGGGGAVIPLRDDIPSRSAPVVTISLIVLNALVYLYELSLGVGGADVGDPGAVRAFMFEFGAMPCRLTGA